MITACVVTKTAQVHGRVTERCDGNRRNPLYLRGVFGAAKRTLGPVFFESVFRQRAPPTSLPWRARTGLHVQRVLALRQPLFAARADGTATAAGLRQSRFAAQVPSPQCGSRALIFATRRA